MKRDADYVRQLLLEFEASDGWRILNSESLNASAEEEKRNYHVHLMCDQGLLMPVGSSVYRLTSYAHDFLDATRDQAVWDKAKTTAAGAGGFTFNLLKDIAVEYLKAKVKEQIGYSPLCPINCLLERA